LLAKLDALLPDCAELWTVFTGLQAKKKKWKFSDPFSSHALGIVACVQTLMTDMSAAPAATASPVLDSILRDYIYFCQLSQFSRRAHSKVTVNYLIDCDNFPPS
jgi:hypothetical protein